MSYQEPFTDVDNSEQSAFNAGFDYLITLTYIERRIDFAFLRKDYFEVNDLLDILWMSLVEWMSDKEKVEHDNLRAAQFTAHKMIMEALRTKKYRVSVDAINNYKTRYIKLKEIIHKKGLRMPKKLDPHFALAK